MNNTLRLILFQNTSKFFIDESLVSRDKAPTDLQKQTAVTIAKNLESIGFLPDTQVIDALAHMQRRDAISVYNNIFAYCAGIKGNQVRNAKIFHPGFPESVIEKDEAQLYLEQICHYFGSFVLGVNWSPEEKVSRSPLIEISERKPEIIGLGTEKDLDDLMHSMMMSGASLPENKIDNLKQYINATNRWQTWIENEKIPNKENLVSIAKIITENKVTNDAFKKKMLSKLFKDANDVLRYAALISNGKTYNSNVVSYGRSFKRETQIENKASLEGNVTFRLSNKEAKLIKALLAECKDLYSAVWSHEKLYKQLGRAISMKQKTPERLKLAYDNLCNNKKIDERGRRILSPNVVIEEADKALLKGDVSKAIKAAINFPGMFSRSFLRFLDHAKTEEDKAKIVDAFGEAAKKTPIREVLKVLNYTNLTDKLDSHVVRVAKTGGYLMVTNNEKRDYSKDLLNKLSTVAIAGIKHQIAGTKDLGKVYVDPKLKDIRLPENGERSASNGATLPYGSNIATDKEKNIIRPFVWWRGRKNDDWIDIDLSAVAYDSDFSKNKQIAYYNQKDSIGIHSGDFTRTTGPDGNGVAEFLDIDKNQLKEQGYRYVVFSAQIYGGSDSYKNLPEVKFGQMEREGSIEKFGDKVDMFRSDEYYLNGEVYDMKTVINNAVDLNADTRTIVPVIYDAELEKYYWVDRQLNLNTQIYNVASGSFENNAKKMIESLQYNPTPTVWQLMSIYASTCGERVNDIKEADTAFVLNSIDKADYPNLQTVLSVKDIDTIAAEYMTPTSTQEGASVEKDLDFAENVDTIKECFVNEQSDEDIDIEV